MFQIQNKPAGAEPAARFIILRVTGSLVEAIGIAEVFWSIIDRAEHPVGALQFLLKHAES